MGTITEEMRMMSLETRRNKVPANVRDDFMDMGYWEQLASDFGVRLPIRGQKATTAKVTPFLKKIGISPAAFAEWMGCKTYREAVGMNPTWGARAICGLILEHRDFILRVYGSAEVAGGE